MSIYEAALRGDVASVTAALAAGVGVNAPDLFGNTALHYACMAGHAKCAKLLLAAGAHPMAQLERSLFVGPGSTPLHAAAAGSSDGCLACAAALLAAGADPCAPNEDAQTPLHVASGHGSLLTVRLLLEAAPHAALLKDGSGNTPLEAAAEGANSFMFSAYTRKRCAITAGYLVNHLALLPEGVQQLQDALLPALAASLHCQKEQWTMPLPCTGLGALLPAALQQSEAQVAWLVRHLPHAEQQRLRTFALCLGAAGRRGLLPLLPSPITHHLLALCAAHPGQCEVLQEQQHVLQRYQREQWRWWLTQFWKS